MKTHNLFIQYGTHMLPIVVKALKEKREGIKALFDFLPQAWRELEQRQSINHSRRNMIRLAACDRQARLSLGRYFDLGRRSCKALRLALQALEKYRDKEDERFLDAALRQYETGERFEKARLEVRLGLPEVVPDCNAWL